MFLFCCCSTFINSRDSSLCSSLHYCTGQTALQPRSPISSCPPGDLYLAVEVIYVNFYLCYSGQSDDKPCCLAPGRRPHSAQHWGPFFLTGARLQSSLYSCGSPSRQAHWRRCDLWLPSSDYNPAEHSQGLLLLLTVPSMRLSPQLRSLWRWV